MSTSVSAGRLGSNGTWIQQSGTRSVAEQKGPLPNPLDLADSVILSDAYLTHLKDDQECDTTVLYQLVPTILSSSSAPLNSQSSLASFKPEFHELKLISCQMIATRGSAQCAHQTTLSVLQRLRSFSWDAKALIAVAAFCLEYGELWRLYRMPTSDSDVVGNSLKQLNQVESRSVGSEVRDLAMYMVEVLPFIRKWAQWYASDYDTEKVPALSLATQELPLVVYWTVASAVAASANLVGIISDYQLSSFKAKLETFVLNLKSHLESCQTQIDKILDYDARLKASASAKDVVALLKLLIHDTPTQSQIPLIYEGTALVKEGVDVFKQKHVLLFISSVDSIVDEIVLLNSLHKRLQENPQQVKKGLKKEDFKILWIPIVDEWNESQKKKFKELRKGITWYVLEYMSELPGVGIIESKFNYNRQEPIVAVINPQGAITNEDARHIIFEWGIEAFPFTKQDAENLKKKWSWLWKLIEKVDDNFSIEATEWRDSYVFIYGGNDKKWVNELRIAIEKIQREGRVEDADVIIEQRELAKDEPDSNRIPYFWIGIDAKKPKKKCQDEVDCEIQSAVESLLCLKKDPLGWVILSKGHHVKLLGHAQPMLQTLVDFNLWKDKVLDKDFDVALREYYDAKVKEISARCHNYTSDVLATITCPNPTCGRLMEITSVNYTCCHRDNPHTCCI